MHVADLIDDEEGVDEIAADSETLVRSGRISVGDQEFVAARDEFRTLFIAEHFEAVDPGTGFGSGGFVVGVGGVFQWTHRMEIGKGELLHGRRRLRREMVRAQGGEQDTRGTSIVTHRIVLYDEPPGPTPSSCTVWLNLVPPKRCVPNKIPAK